MTPAQYRLALEGNPVFTALRLERDSLKETLARRDALLRECLPRIGVISIYTEPPIALPPDDLRDRIRAELGDSHD